MGRRWLKFNAVGAIGVVVQLAALALLKGVLGLPYLAATALAVEIAVLHNFVWHERWTWRDRAGTGTFARLLRFNLTTGLISVVANLVLMRILVGHFHVPYLAANVMSIALCSVANFLAADVLVFRKGNLRQNSRTTSRNVSLPCEPE